MDQVVLLVLEVRWVQMVLERLLVLVHQEVQWHQQDLVALHQHITATSSEYIAIRRRGSAQEYALSRHESRTTIEDPFPPKVPFWDRL